jgi:hypothetical protein
VPERSAIVQRKRAVVIDDVMILLGTSPLNDLDPVGHDHSVLEGRRST